MVSYIVSTLYWSFVVVSSILFFPVAVLIKLSTFPFDSRLVALHWFTCFWASLYTWLNPFWKIKINGIEKIRSDETYVMVSNHQSLIDILVVFRFFTHFKWVSKIENFRVPMVGWNMILNRYIKLTRGSTRSNIKMIKDCQATLKQNNSIMVFPEGTRSRDGMLRAFKPGAFEMAIRSKRPVLPIVLNGSANALPKAGIRFSGKHVVRVDVLDAIPYHEFANNSAKELTKKVHSLINEKLERMQSEDN